MPVIVVTMEGDMNKLAAVEQRGVPDICDKPFESHAIKNMVEAIMAA